MKRTITLCIALALLVATSSLVAASDHKWIVRGNYVKTWPSTDSYQTESVIGDDSIFNDPHNMENEIKWMDRLSEWYSPGEILIMATGTAGELLQLSGTRNPYPGDLGVVKEGAFADLLLVDGNPLEDVKVVGQLENLRVIIKDGQVYKNTL